MDKLPDKIEISWHILDVKSLDDTLSDEQARQVLQVAKHDHDAMIGINWDTLKADIQIVKDGI